MYPLIEKVKTGQWLQIIFAMHNLSPKDIQDYLSLGCIQTVYRWMNGTNIPSIDHLYAISSLVGMTVDRLVVGDTEGERQRKEREICTRIACYIKHIK